MVPPVDDDIMNDPKEGDGSGTGTAKPPAPQANGGVSLDQVQQMLSPLTEGMQTLTAQMAQLAASQQNGAGSGDGDGDEPSGGEMSGDFKEFIDLGPKKYLEKHGPKDAAERIGPVLSILLDQAGQSAYEKQIDSIKTEYGDGAFEEFFAKDFEAALKDIPEDSRAAARASSGYMDAMVSGILGRLYRNPETRGKLEERRTKVQNERKEAEEAGLLGPGRPLPLRRGQASPEAREFVAHLQEKGIKYTLEDFQKDVDTPSTAEAWQERFDKEAKASK